jgi:hypothetical protein
MKKNTKIYLGIGALLLVIIGIIIGLVVYFNMHASSDANTTVINSSNPATTTTSQQINENSGKKTITPINVSTKPLNVNIVTGSDNPNIVKTYNNNSPITNITVKENVNKQIEIDKSKILNNNDVNNSSVGQNFSQSSTSNLP